MHRCLLLLLLAGVAAQAADASLPEFRGDKEQLIQTVLNIAHNAAQALADSGLSSRLVIDCSTSASVM
mgnify:CR=1 FL=1